MRAILLAGALVISHIQKNTVCLTAQQLDDLDQRNQRIFDQPSRGAANGLPPMGSSH